MARKLKYEATIAGADNGFIVRAGCMLLVFTDVEELIKEFTAYVRGEKTALTEGLDPEPGMEPQTCEEVERVSGDLANSVARPEH